MRAALWSAWAVGCLAANTSVTVGSLLGYLKVCLVSVGLREDRTLISFKLSKSELKSGAMGALRPD